MSKMYVKPNPERATVVRDPATARPLPAAGGWVAKSAYWNRRLRDQDVIAAKPPTAAKAQKEPGATTRQNQKKGEQ
ncbi:hypothetical protein BN2364_1066 [Alloalcanivorax xenomutans]|uniref:DUF2635 domain-containing protein n=1 Tax=Alloalcanivorax xenomutans TaxID=1094342 RepID=UPI0006D5C81A|nr:DUF2635 domain-containing protein [Alloalcanivorax xenomutans]CUR45507.1 hypothetical protein BN2364_1066 [Alloalcanivorax xenomutans]